MDPMAQFFDSLRFPTVVKVLPNSLATASDQLGSHKGRKGTICPCNSVAIYLCAASSTSGQISASLSTAAADGPKAIRSALHARGARTASAALA